MLRPSMYDIITKGDNYYKFVVAVSMRAREINEEILQSGSKSTEKTVETAVNEFASRKVRVSDFV